LLHKDIKERRIPQMQKTIHIEDGTGSEVLLELNEAFETIATDFSGGTEPQPTYAGMSWLDTSQENAVLKKRNADNTAWLEMGTLTPDGFQPANVLLAEDESVTKQGNVFNQPSKLLQLDASGAVPSKNLAATSFDKLKIVTDYLYTGINLEEKFAEEIANYSSVYAWLEERKNTGNFEGIHVGDYFYTTMKAGTVAGYSLAQQTFTCRIVGINTYKSCADVAIGNMFYIMTDEVIDTPIKWNPADNNNGTATQNNPWLASAMYAILNGVNNYSTNAYNKVAHGANASGKGILQLLPSGLQEVLKQKRNLLDSRYSASGLLTGSTGWNWGDMGKLWLPNEIEVYGCGIRSNLCQTAGFWFPEAGLSIQFPWFANNCEHRIKRNSTGGRCSWWLSAAASYYTTYVCSVSGHGLAGSYLATHASIFVPLCFCI